MSFWRNAALLVFLAAVAVVPAQAAEVPVRAFAKLPQYTRVRLSPTGEYLAVTIPQQDRTGIAIIRLSDMKLVAGGKGGEKTHFGSFWWANDHRVVVEKAVSWGALEAPFDTGAFMTLDARTARLEPLYPTGDWAQARSMRAVAWGTLVSTLRGSVDHVLIHTESLGNRLRMLHRLNVETRRLDDIAFAPLPGAADFVTDDDGELHYAVGTDEKTLTTRTFAFVKDAKQDADRWREIGRPEPGRSFQPFRLSPDRKVVYARARDGTDKDCLVAFSPESGAVRQLACHPHADLENVLFSADGSVPIAATFEAGVPELVWLEKAHPDAVTLASLIASFKGQAVVPVSWTTDGRKLLFFVYGGRSPGDYFLYDRDKKDAKYLLSASSWIDPAAMAEVRAIDFKTRDGARVFGYLTLPPGRKPEGLPLVVMPHGGPFFIRDYWQWDAEAQVMASRGYAVLQVNFRGSAGYGFQHVDSARKAWGTVMVNDLVDGVRWTIGQGIADADRVCAFGASYGAYASMTIAVREPELLRCVVAYAGVYDLQLIRSDDYAYGTEGFRTFLNEYIGSDQQQLREQSPINHVEKLKAPVFIVHGQMDRVSTPEHAYDLRKALEARKHPTEWLMKSGEAHGFYNEDNRTELFEKLLDFLDRHIGERRPAAKP